MTHGKYFTGSRSAPQMILTVFVALLFVFSVVFFLWSAMKANKIKKEIKENEAYIEQLTDENERLRYLLDSPMDDAYKIRIAREKLGMCFPEEIIFHTEME